MSAAPQAIAATRALEAVMRNDRGRLISALIARLRDFQLAEEVLQEAAVSALTHWGRSGLPASPQGWLLKVALRKAIDRLRGHSRDNRRAAEMAVLAADEADETDPDRIPDERLCLIFTCCHPALESKSRVALTLRTVSGLTTSEIAAAFLDAEPTMGQRLSRAKAKIAAAGIPFAIPAPEDWEARLHSVLTVVYLIFNAGYTQPTDDPRNLASEAVFLARLLDQLRPEDPEIEGALALMLFAHARRHARIDAHGATLPPQDQNRALWDHAQLAQADDLLRRALGRGHPGPHQIRAAISACHVLPETPDWPQILALYHTLLRYEPTPVVQLNCVVALAETGQAAAALAQLETLQDDLADYQPYHAARADLLARTGNHRAALAAYDQAIARATHSADAAFLHQRRAKLP
jgi:RNA polymerase sigma-70 factor (ECF subfamily)